MIPELSSDLQNERMLKPSQVVSLLTTEFLTTSEVASLLRITRWELNDWRRQRRGPPFVMLKRGVIRYPPTAFETYLRSHSQCGSSAVSNRHGAGRQQVIHR